MELIPRTVPDSVLLLACIWSLTYLTSVVSPVDSTEMPYEWVNRSLEEYPLPPLTYGYGDLEPVIDAATVKVHYEGHHAAYTKKMNTVLKQWRNEIPESDHPMKPIIRIIEEIHMVPDKYRTAVQNNGGGYVNHAFYWSVMAPSSRQVNQPTGTIAGLIKKSFGSFKEFQTKFTQYALNLFGSGYVWLCWDYENDGSEPLSIVTTANQDCPVTLRFKPILVLDLWEHAYYLKHQNRRPDHVADWWKVVNWSAVEQLYTWWGGKRFNEEPDDKDEL